MPAQRPRAAGGVDYLANIGSQLSAMSASISVLQQKITQIGRNETILNKNFITLNNKVKELEKKVAAGGGVTSNEGDASGEVQTVLQDEVRALSQEVLNLKTIMQNTGAGGIPVGISENDIRRLKYIVETIDPIKFVTIEQVDQLIDEKFKRR